MCIYLLCIQMYSIPLYILDARYKPGSKLKDSPLFLDHVQLIQKVVDDLKQDICHLPVAFQVAFDSVFEVLRSVSCISFTGLRLLVDRQLQSSARFSGHVKRLDKVPAGLRTPLILSADMT